MRTRMLGGPRDPFHSSEPLLSCHDLYSFRLGGARSKAESHLDVYIQGSVPPDQGA